MQQAESSEPVEAALRRLVLAWRAGEARDSGDVAAMTPSMFRATVAERLRALERDVAEVRARVNGLLFVVTGAVLTQIVLGLIGG